MRSLDSIKITFLSTTMLVAFLIGANAYGLDRDIASMKYPRLRNTKNTQQILRHYPRYLKFVLEIGKQSNRKTAKRLEKNYKLLAAKSPEEAARFLRGLRFELNHKLDLLHIDKKRVTTRTKAIRRMVQRYLIIWAREADEHLFRAITIKKVRDYKGT